MKLIIFVVRNNLIKPNLILRLYQYYLRSQCYLCQYYLSHFILKQYFETYARKNVFNIGILVNGILWKIHFQFYLKIYTNIDKYLIVAVLKAIFSKISGNIINAFWNIAGIYETARHDVDAFRCEAIYVGRTYVTNRTCDSSHVKVTTVTSAKITVEEVLHVAGETAGGAAWSQS